jgi:hypothetical protein
MTSTLCRFRKRVGSEGIGHLENAVFSSLKEAQVIDASMALIDSTVLESPILYPTDVTLLRKAFHKMALLAKRAKIEPWWDQAQVKQLWRAYHLDHSQPLAYLCVFYGLFEPALETFANLLEDLPDGHLKTRWHQLLETLLILDEQTQLKLEGQHSIKAREQTLSKQGNKPLKMKGGDETSLDPQIINSGFVGSCPNSTLPASSNHSGCAAICRSIVCRSRKLRSSGQST